MGAQHVKRIAKLQEYVVPLEPLDTMAEAGRKVLLVDFIKMLQHEAGSRTGEDLEDVHIMRVSTRRLRSALRLLEEYFKPGTVYPFQRRLRKLARALGAIRDLDVLIEDMQKFQTTLDAPRQATLRSVMDALDSRRAAARSHFIAVVDSQAYSEFVKEFSRFLTTPGLGTKPVNMDGVAPYQIRHVLPVVVHHHLAAVRAYDTVIENADEATIHALRIAFKRLRYTVSFFEGVLGQSVEGFIDGLKVIQDVLGRLNDIRVAREHMEELLSGDVDGAQAEVISHYMAVIEAERAKLQGDFTAVWEHFNSRVVQRKLSDSMLVLR